MLRCFNALALAGLGGLGLAACATPPASDAQSPSPNAVETPAVSDPGPAQQDAPATAAAAATLSAAEIDAIVADRGRTASDFKDDGRRDPRPLLAFLQLRRGMRVADIGAALGYTTELLARAVGPTGVVYGQNPKFVLERFAEQGWSERLRKPALANVVRLDREFADPFPAEIEPLDLVVNVLFYHDFEWQGVDRAAHNRDVFAALRPGGRYVIVDASAKPGAGASGSETLHRIEEQLVIAELTAAGFELGASGEFLRNANDTRDWNALPWAKGAPKEFSDKFVLEFRKPG